MKTDYLSMVSKCIEFIEENLTNKLTIEDVLEKTYYSYPQFNRIFYDFVGETVTSYIRKRKLSRAAEELVQTEKEIVDIALDYQFASQQTFNRAFTDYFQVSPLKYRNTGMLGEIFKPYVMKDSITEVSLPIMVNIETLLASKIAKSHVYCDDIQAKIIEREQEKIISKAWGNLIHWQMSYEYGKAYGKDKKLPPTAKLGKFMIDNGLHLSSNVRYFGYTNPFPFNQNEFGYEAWAMLGADFDSDENSQDTADIELDSFEGGLYAVAEATYGENSNMNEVWKALHLWLANNPQYEYGDHQWLEEHLTKEGVGDFHGFKLYLPIKAI